MNYEKFLANIDFILVVYVYRISGNFYLLNMKQVFARDCPELN